MLKLVPDAIQFPRIAAQFAVSLGASFKTIAPVRSVPCKIGESVALLHCIKALPGKKSPGKLYGADVPEANPFQRLFLSVCISFQAK